MRQHQNAIKKEPVEIAKGIYWVGYSDINSGLHCNPYLIIEEQEAVLIDGGSRDDFSNVMLKILRTGLDPSQITRLIYQHYDPDLCGSLPQLESIIGNDSLKIISHHDNNIFIHYYSPKTKKLDFRDLDNHFDFATGRRLEFYATPYCHQLGSFITYDRQTKTLFSSDLFGSFDTVWRLFHKLSARCKSCRDAGSCAQGSVCPIKGIKQFHQRIMTSNLAAAHTMSVIESLDIDRIAPQHGSIISSREDIETIIRHLRSEKNVGIEFLLSGENQ
jgi:flavorubredoxin